MDEPINFKNIYNKCYYNKGVLFERHPVCSYIHLISARREIYESFMREELSDLYGYGMAILEMGGMFTIRSIWVWNDILEMGGIRKNIDAVLNVAV